MTQQTEGMLSPCRVLDLTDEKGLLCGKLLGDLGADVIKVERPSGDPARNIGPFYHDEADPEKSLFWFAFNASKRGITLDIETADGRAIFKKLVKTADFVIESFPPGYMDKLGLGYPELEKLNPGIILVSITPFGQTGPYKDYKVSDIVAWAMGGYMYQWGDPDRPPVRISHHSQAYLEAATEAAAGAIAALYHQELTGEGQQVDVSIQECVAWYTHYFTGVWDAQKRKQPRGTGMPQAYNLDIPITRLWPCKDGYVSWVWWGQGKRSSPPFAEWLAEWMESKGMAADFIREWDWDIAGYMSLTQEVVDSIEEPTGKFFMAHTRAELLEGALKRHVQLYPVSTPEDIMKGTPSVQLTARDYWVELEHPELGASITYPGAFAYTSAVLPRVSRRAPLIGEHNQEIYERELGIPREQLQMLKQAGVI